jgi:Na+/proline symporter
MYILLLVLGLALGPVIYVAMTFVGKPAEDYKDFHYAGRTLTPADLVSTTVAYALQVAVLTLFATWGFEYGISSMWVPIFWALGYLLLARMVESGRLDAFLRQDGLGTIHAFLALRYRFRALAVLAALASLIGLWGPAMYEAYFAGNLVSRLFDAATHPSQSDSFISEYTVLFFAAFLLVAAAYMLYGGFRHVVWTDIIQLAMGYSLFSVALSIMLFSIARSGHLVPAATILAILVAVSGLLIWYWCRNLWRVSDLLRRACALVPLVIAFASYTIALSVVPR